MGQIVRRHDEDDRATACDLKALRARLLPSLAMRMVYAKTYRCAVGADCEGT